MRKSPYFTGLNFLDSKKILTHLFDGVKSQEIKCRDAAKFPG